MYIGEHNFAPSGVYETSYPCDHVCVDETHPGPPYRTGGPFTVTKKSIYLHRFDTLNASFSALGWCNVRMGVNPYVPGSAPTPTSLSGWGAKGWSRTQPLHPITNLGVSLIELRDLPRMISQTKAGLKALANLPNTLKGAGQTVGSFLSSAEKLSRNSGDAYLYGAFGVYPMLKDLLGFYDLQKKLDRKISWLRRHNGKAVRRKVELDSWEYSENIARTIAPTSTCYPSLSSTLYAPGQTSAVSIPILKSYKRRIWYSAKYRYWIPELAKPFSPVPNRLKADLLGLSLDPSIIYKVTRWSWLLDWFTSVGSAMSNVYSRWAYHVVAEYAYVMCSETLTYKCPGYVTMHQGKFTTSWSKPDRVQNGVSTTVYEMRSRAVANPYGFGITFASLSAYQWSILAALGLSRSYKLRT